jgi:hypothetical protein
MMEASSHPDSESVENLSKNALLRTTRVAISALLV